MSATFTARLKSTIRAATTATVIGAAAIGLAGTAAAEMYGDPEAAAEYWEVQSLDDCVLMAVADVVGQLTGDKPSEVEIVGVAMITPSDSHPGSVYIPAIDSFTYLGDGMGTHMYDAVTMLAKYDIEALYTDGEFAGTDEYSPATGMDALADYLADGHKVIVSLNSAMIWDEPGGDTQWADHAVVVTGVDTTEGIVHLNDSGIEFGRNLQVPIEVFEKSWATDDYTMVVTVPTS